MTTPTRGCKRRLFASTRIEDLLGPYLSISATSQSTLSPSDEERHCRIIPRYCASRVGPRADSQQVGATYKKSASFLRREASATISRKLSLNNIHCFWDQLCSDISNTNLLVNFPNRSRANPSELHGCSAAIIQVLPAQG